MLKKELEMRRERGKMVEDEDVRAFSVCARVMVYLRVPWLALVRCVASEFNSEMESE